MPSFPGRTETQLVLPATAGNGEETVVPVFAMANPDGSISAAGKTAITNSDGTQQALISSGSDGQGGGAGLVTLARMQSFNGASWDRVRGSADGLFAQGNVASGAADVGNPLKVGGRYNAAPPTLADGQRGDLQLDTRGNLEVTLFAPNGTQGVGVVAVTSGALANTAQVGLNVNSVSRIVSGTSSYAWAGTTTGYGYVVTAAPDASAVGALTPVVAQGVFSISAKAAAGNFFGAAMLAGASAGFMIAYNAAAAPAAGAALTPTLVLGVVPVGANEYKEMGDYDYPERFGAGIQVLFSTSLTTYTQPTNPALFMKVRSV